MTIERAFQKKLVYGWNDRLQNSIMFVNWGYITTLLIIAVRR